MLQDDLNIQPTQLDSPDNLDENQGLGLNAFVNNLKGAKKLRQRVREQVASQAASTKQQVASEISTSKQSLKTSS